MKKLFTLVCAAIAVFAMSSCKSQESAYKRAYEKAAKNQQTEAISAAETVTPTVTPTTVTNVQPVAPVQPATTDPSSVAVRTESVRLVSGTGLQAYNVVCGSFGIQSNAEGLQNVLKSKGYPAQVVLNPVNNMFRVVATTHADKASAVASRDQLRAAYPDAWLLLNK